MMIGTSGIGNTPGERTMRTNSAPLSSGISQSRITMSGPTVRIASSAGDAVARLVDLAHADIDQQSAHDLAHELVVVDDQHAEALDEKLDVGFATVADRRIARKSCATPGAHLTTVGLTAR